MKICEHCRIGVLQAQEVTWARLMGPHLVIVPNVHAYVCDLCGFTTFESEKLDLLETLLWSGNGLEVETHNWPPSLTGSGDWPRKRIVPGA